MPKSGSLEDGTAAVRLPAKASAVQPLSYSLAKRDSSFKGKVEGIQEL